jgi:hypothetical protein
MCEKGGSSRTFWSFPFNAGGCLGWIGKAPFVIYKVINVIVSSHPKSMKSRRESAELDAQ